ncbi:NB-ARC domain-containing protein [Trichormus sp. NMC-1]|uniref:NB-ARC domain-containing protein n=1 Tax=Trichormus sp. NMC-1 TaxID=1853259 RepID=UPI0008DC0FFD|nr:NB-ARC domain-containing protein [Trichormus sp. NMC-1]
MDIKEVLQFADELVFVQTGKHLDDIQDTVIKGVWQGHTYEEIAAQCNRSESHVRDVGYKLWQILSEQLNEDINKRNFRSVLSRLQITSSPVIIQNNNHNFNFYSSYQTKDDDNTIKNDDKKQLFANDLTLSPKITHFYGRETELQTLSHWLINQNNRLISILGLPGIGKTTLVKHFIDLNLQKFDLVIWKSIKLSHSLDNILTEILTFTKSNHSENNKLTQFLNLLNQKRCLIILDDIQEIFILGQFAGQYKPEYKDYKTFFTKIAEIEHQSSLILISQEQCQEMLCLDEELYSVKCLELSGLSNIDIFHKLKLKDEQIWSNLIDLYGGNLVYLKDISNVIKNIFQGSVADFINEGFLLTEDMKFQLDELFNRLSPIEKNIISTIGKFSQPVAREHLKATISLSSTELINGLQSLNRRYLLTTIETEKTLFNLSPIFQEYVKITEADK